MPTPLLSRFPLRESADDPRRGLIGAVMLAGGIQGRDNLALADFDLTTSEIAAIGRLGDRSLKSYPPDPRDLQ